MDIKDYLGKISTYHVLKILIVLLPYLVQALCVHMLQHRCSIGN
uniref:Uncharacterized protein n=1 Tax=Arundo donax TaxID=35708 RepID=A0A0A9CIX5_ARUDO